MVADLIIFLPLLNSEYCASERKCLFFTLWCVKRVVLCLLPWQVLLDSTAFAMNSSSSASSRQGGPAPSFLLFTRFVYSRSSAILLVACPSKTIDKHASVGEAFSKPSSLSWLFFTSQLCNDFLSYCVRNVRLRSSLLFSVNDCVLTRASPLSCSFSEENGLDTILPLLKKQNGGRSDSS